MPKTDQTLSAIFRQLRPSLRQPLLECSHSRALSQLSPLRHSSFPRPSYMTKVGVTKSLLPLRSLQVRRISESTSAPASAVTQSPDYPSNTLPPPDKPAYQLTFTCKPCRHRSTHTVSKHGYHNGTVLITCPQCSNRHVISDHLKIFGDKSFTIEDLMRQKGQLVKRGALGGNGDIEFWDDDSQTENGPYGSN